MFKTISLSLFTYGIFVLASSSTTAYPDWSGLSSWPDPIDIANWMTPQRAEYFSQGVREGCSRQETLIRYYYGSLAVCNAYKDRYKDWYEQLFASSSTSAQANRSEPPDLPDPSNSLNWVIEQFNAYSSAFWSGLPDAPDPIDIANWMTPQRAEYFSQGVREGCSRQETLIRDYYGSLAVCNAYHDWYEDEFARLEEELRETTGAPLSEIRQEIEQRQSPRMRSPVPSSSEIRREIEQRRSPRMRSPVPSSPAPVLSPSAPESGPLLCSVLGISSIIPRCHQLEIFNRSN